MIDTTTNLYCIFGKPVKHSKSPAVHNACFEHYNIKAVYLAFEIDDIESGIKAIKTLDIKGASITIPFKETIFKYLDFVDDDTLNIGAVNTIVNKNNKLYGYNTDFIASICPLKSFGIAGKKVCIIGAGGAAKAIAYGIHKEKGKIIIVNRSKQRGEELSFKYNADFILAEDLKKINKLDVDVLINTTSIGMSPYHDKDSPFSSHLLSKDMIVMDIVYNPIETRLLYEAKNKDCKIINGLSMFVYQAALQFELWTKILPDLNIMKKALIIKAK